MLIKKFLPTARKRMHCISSDICLLQAAKLLERDHDMLVVCDAGDRMIGVLTKIDAVRQIGICTGASCTAPVTQAMTRDVMTETPSSQLKDVWEMIVDFRENLTPGGGRTKSWTILEIVHV